MSKKEAVSKLFVRLAKQVDNAWPDHIGGPSDFTIHDDMTRFRVFASAARDVLQIDCAREELVVRARIKKAVDAAVASTRKECEAKEAKKIEAIRQEYEEWAKSIGSLKLLSVIRRTKEPS